MGPIEGLNKASIRQLESHPEARCPGGLRFFNFGAM